MRLYVPLKCCCMLENFKLSCQGLADEVINALGLMLMSLLKLTLKVMH